MGPNSHQDLCNLLPKGHRTFFTENRRNRSGKISFPILDISSRSGDIRDQSRRLYKIDLNFACFGPQIFLGGGPPEFLDLDYKIQTVSDNVAKFRGNRPRDFGERVAKEKKHHQHFVRPPVTTYGRPNYRN